jgi:protein ImuB
VVVEDNRILLRDAAAIDAGIAPGASLATAHSILPGLRHHPRQIERERQRLELIGEALYGFSSRVALSEPVATRAGAGAMLEIGASLKLFGEAGELARRVAELCRNLGHQVAVRSAATPLAALILARAGAARLEEVPLPLAAVEPGRLAEERIERLANVGVRTLGQLLALPASGVSQRFGSDLTDYLARITGERPDPRHLVRPRQRFRTTAHLLDPVSDKQALGFPIQRRGSRFAPRDSRLSPARSSDFVVSVPVNSARIPSRNAAPSVPACKVFSPMSDVAVLWISFVFIG